MRRLKRRVRREDVLEDGDAALYIHLETQAMPLFMSCLAHGQLPHGSIVRGCQLVESTRASHLPCASGHESTSNFAQDTLLYPTQGSPTNHIPAWGCALSHHRIGSLTLTSSAKPYDGQTYDGQHSSTRCYISHKTVCFNLFAVMSIINLLKVW